ncbi:hypothetical protein K1719_023795 [Acacia pycnantha]|nr:hypothetical protein K1719_023795 [Acacia pycnantha]
MAIVTGDRYLEKLVKFVDEQAGPLIEGTLVLKLNPAGLHYVQSRLEALHELESLLAGAPVDYLRAYVSDLGDHRAIEQLRRILRLLTSLKVVSVLPPPTRDPTPLSFLPFGRLKVLELRGCDLSTSAAKGLLELRHTLEKIVCHNSTDALRHLFASRIADIKNSPQWNRLSFVSCACNGLVLMDESLQLLPAVETLDLSRNKFAKVDNLRKCTKLKHLDLGFNHLRTIAPFNEVSFHIVKLVLRNNALTTLRGIEKLKSLEGLDVSYNIISNFSELQFLTGLPVLQSLWLEGNPLCCARWYRAQVFSFFTFPEKLKLDDKEMNTGDFWKRRLITASKHRRPSSFGIYLPAKDEDVEQEPLNRRRKASRLACIENEEDITSICSDQESVSCGSDVQSRDDRDLSDGEAEIVDLINKVEHMKKERSSFWLREFKEWMDIDSGKFLESSKEGRSLLHSRKEKYIKNGPNQGQTVEVSRYASDSVLASGDESSLNIVESDSSFVDTSASFRSQQYFESRGLLDNAGGAPLNDLEGVDQEGLKSHSLKGISNAFSHSRSSHFDTHTIQEAHRIAEKGDLSPLTTIDDISGSHSSVCPSSPPHFQEDLLQRRQNLVEEILQLPADSFSVASSDSNTSCSEVDYSGYEQSVPEIDNFCNKDYVNRDRDSTYQEREVAVILSSHMKLYLLRITAADESGIHLSLLSCHKAEEVCEVLVGVGLQVLRVNFKSGETYLFITRSIQKSRELLQILQVSDSCGVNERCSIISLEQVQVESFDNQICGGSNLSIYQYAMVLVCCNNSKEESWLSRSLFVIGGYVLLCIEDVTQFCLFSSNASRSPYFRIDSCCLISDICEAVIDVKERFCLTLVLEHLMSEFHQSTDASPHVVNNSNQNSGSIKLKLQWFSRNNLLKFVSLLKAIHGEKMGPDLFEATYGWNWPLAIVLEVNIELL